MPIIQKIPTVSNRIHPLAIGAAGSVILLCVVATAAILGWLPGRGPSPYTAPDTSALSSAPPGAPVAVPATTRQPRVRRAAHLTSST
ncbi:hypothetical protein [Pseudoduganella namucuonensis]|uniref:Uncharacterized protein n=1 Tax=Pseudoduganella namucuonensis TaxID=1035707 RepID=A0A1I7L9N8_9BURK|nr:hypothetical protein [Pseudoduganella namucuonensis]SFV06482.1 hypothetical protein SAMN05216552_102560 [Pseudoduganella namucuonensis]